VRPVITALVLSASVLSALNASAAVTERAYYRTITIPAGTPLHVSLSSQVSSKTNSAEDAVTGRLRRAIVIEGVAVVPAGAIVRGHVVEAVRSGRVRGRAHVALRFTALRAADGRHRIRTAAISREAVGTDNKDAARIGIGTGAGAVVGAVRGGKGGAVIGSAIGAAASAGLVLATRGDEVTLVPGTIVTTKLTAPLEMRVRIP